jgi:prostaglandin-endoperoxide synthase 2
MAPYTSWASLTDRTYSGRHLPPVVSQGSANPRNAPPDSAKVASLFERGDDMIECPKSTVLFSFFAQWFTDGFLRTSRDLGPDGVRNTLKTDSSHEIDLSQLYGRTSPGRAGSRVM